MERVLSARGGLTTLSLYPLPDLRFIIRIGKDYQVLVSRPRHLMLDLPAM
jgi:hypothetical protein